MNGDLTDKTANLEDLIAQVEQLEAQLSRQNDDLVAKVQQIEQLEFTCQVCYWA